MAMPLGDFASEVMSLLESNPDADQILVGRVKPQRFAVANGEHDELLDVIAGHRLDALLRSGVL
jgi:uncharacterized oxidoreductase